MTVRVLLFAGLKQLVEAPFVSVELPDHATVADLRRVLSQSSPKLAPWLPNVRIAVDGEFAPDDHPISPSAEVALIPPVSGGGHPKTKPIR
jgi:molybdopterin converting factor subunit 1